MNLKEQRDALWALLDDIDTLDDSARSHNKLFRDQARKIQKKRWDIHNPEKSEPTDDGMSLLSCMFAHSGPDDLTEEEVKALAYLTPNLLSLLERNSPHSIEETRRLARQEFVWILRQPRAKQHSK